VTDDKRTRMDQQDPGAYIGSEPEREAETIPGGVKPGDQRIAAYDSQPGVEGEPEDTGMTTGPEEDFPPSSGD
jgi:hypothetical protein